MAFLCFFLPKNTFLLLTSFPPKIIWTCEEFCLKILFFWPYKDVEDWSPDLYHNSNLWTYDTGLCKYKCTIISMGEVCLLAVQSTVVLFVISYVPYFPLFLINYTIMSLDNGSKCHNSLVDAYSFINNRFIVDKIASPDKDVFHSFSFFPLLLFSIQQKYVS